MEKFNALEFANRVTAEDGILMFWNLNTEELLVLGTAISLDRCNASKVTSAELYSLTWMRVINLEEVAQEELFGGLDNYITDLGSIMQSVEEGELDVEEVNLDQIHNLYEIAEAMFNVVDSFIKERNEE